MLTAQHVRNMIPVPVIHSHGLALIIGGIVFIIGLAWIYDAYDGQGLDAPFPFGAILPW